jgi:hypothetical protein
VQNKYFSTVRSGLTGHEFVPFQAVYGTLLEEDFGLIEEENCFPLGDHLKDITQRLLDGLGLGTQLGGAHGIQGYAHMFSH